MENCYRWNIINKILPILLVAAVTGVCFSLLCRFDNKYENALPSISGTSVLRSGEEEHVSFLVDGWEYYPGRLLTPKDFPGAAGAAQTTYIGKSPNFISDLETPYGTATYRLILRCKGDFPPLSLYIPEPLSASRIFINGMDYGAEGSLAPYRPLIRDRILSFTPACENEILIQAANYSHYYSGLYYPPAIGNSQSISLLVTARTAVYSLFCFGSMTIALSNLAIWTYGLRRHRDKNFRRSNQLLLIFGALCAAFAVQTSYPFFLQMGIHMVRPFYALLDFCGSAVLLCAILIVKEISTPAGGRFYHTFLIPAAVAMCAVCVLFPMAVLPAAPLLTGFYGYLISFWKLSASACLTVMSVRGILQGNRLSRYHTAASLIYGMSVLASVITIGRFEPAVGGWPEEYGGFAFVLVFAAMMVRRSSDLMDENFRLTARLEEEVAKKTADLSTLLDGRKKFLADLVHDLKAPLAAVRSYGELIRSSGIGVDDETERYLAAIHDRIALVDERFEILREFTAGEQPPLTPELLNLNKFIADFHRNNQPDIEMDGHRFLLSLTEEPLSVFADRQALRRVLENLCYNALAFSPEESAIRLALRPELEKRHAVITVADDGEGIVPEDLPHIFDRHFHRRKEDGHGLGLYIARSLVIEQGGEIVVNSSLGKGTVFSIFFPLRESESDSISKSPEGIP